MARVPGVRKGCVVAFGAIDPVAGTERLVIVAESRERNRDARARLAQAITAQVTETLGLPPNVVEVVSTESPCPKTSSGKLRRDATKQRFLNGELNTDAPPVWLQLARLGASSIAGRVRGSARRAAEIAYGCYALALFVLLLFPVWLYVLITPSRKTAARATTAALRAYLKLAGWRVHVEGRENLRENKPRMFVANHTSYADIVVLMAALGTDYHFVAKAEVMSMPFFGTFLLASSAISHSTAKTRKSACTRPNKSRTRYAAANPFLFFRRELSPRNPACAPFILARSKRPSRRSAKSCPSRSMALVALFATAHLCSHPGRITITIAPPIAPPSYTEDWQQIVRVRDEARETIARFAHETLL